MSSRKKQSKKQAKSDQAAEHKDLSRVPVFEPEFREDLGWWYRNEPQKAFKVLDIVEASLMRSFQTNRETRTT
ncbi:MAG TPA: hypothetical protein V6D09_08275 [Leptolyngbyaceae cyanobacterium]